MVIQRGEGSLVGRHVRAHDPDSQKMPEEDNRECSIDLRGVVDVGGRGRNDHKLRAYIVRVV